MSEERRLLQELETIGTSDPPLTADEMQRLTRDVLRRAGQAGAQTAVLRHFSQIFLPGQKNGPGATDTFIKRNYFAIA